MSERKSFLICSRLLQKHRTQPFGPAVLVLQRGGMGCCCGSFYNLGERKNYKARKKNFGPCNFFFRRESFADFRACLSAVALRPLQVGLRRFQHYAERAPSVHLDDAGGR